MRAAREGANVACVDRKVKELNATVEMIRSEGDSAFAIIADVSRTADADAMVFETVERLGHLDLARTLPG